MPQSPSLQAPQPGINLRGLIALIIAIVATVFSCIKPLMVVGWVLLPIALALSLSALFPTNRRLGLPIAALVMSVLGGIIAAVAFFMVVARDFDQGMDEWYSSQAQSTDSSIGDDDEDEPEEDPWAKWMYGPTTPESTVDNPLTIGTTFTIEDWKATVNYIDLDATAAVMEASETNPAPADGMTYILINVTLTYEGTNPNGVSAWTEVEYVAPDGTIYPPEGEPLWTIAPDDFDILKRLTPGSSNTGNFAFEVPLAGLSDGVVSLTPDVLMTPGYFAVK